MGPKVVTCPNCGAAVPPAKNALQAIRCTFCETEFHPPAPEPRPSVVIRPQTVTRIATPEEVAAHKRFSRKLGCGIFLLASTFIGLSAFVAYQQEQEAKDRSKKAQRDSKRHQDEVQDEINARVYWWTRYLPGFGQVDDDPLIVGSVRRYSGGSYIVAIDTDGEERWSVGPMDPEDEHFRAHSFVSGQRVLTANSDHEILVLSLDTGEIIQTFEARSDKITAFCLDEEDPSRVRVKVSDKSHVRVNLQTNQLESLNDDDLKDCESGSWWLEKKLKGTDQRVRHPEPENTKIEHALFSTDGRTAVGGGYKSPGSGTPRAWGWATETGKISWTKDLTDSKKVDDRSNEWGVLLGSTYITHFEDDDIHMLIALDATNGETLWETPIYEDEDNTPTIDDPELLIGDGDHLVVTAGSGIWIFEAETGERLGFYGDP